MIKAVLFDLDGTLLPMDQDRFVERYMGLLAGAMAPHGLEPRALVGTVWEGVKAMVANDGSRTNDEAFWEVFAQRFGDKTAEKRPLIEAFYDNEFLETRDVCEPVPEAAAAVRRAKELGFDVALATNPIFPRKATRARLSWTGLDPDEFAFVTTYEDWGLAKPNPAYFSAVAEALGLEPEECAMVGNDLVEDGAARSVGMELFILTPCMIDPNGTGPGDVPHGGWPELMAWIDGLAER